MIQIEPLPIPTLKPSTPASIRLLACAAVTTVGETLHYTVTTVGETLHYTVKSESLLKKKFIILNIFTSVKGTGVNYLF